MLKFMEICHKLAIGHTEIRHHIIDTRVTV